MFTKDGDDVQKLVVDEKFFESLPEGGSGVHVCCCRENVCNNANFAKFCGDNSVLNNSRGSFASGLLVALCFAIVKVLFL